MKYKKYLAITLVAFLFATAISSTANAGIFMSSSSPSAEIQDQGTMCLEKVDQNRGDVYIIDECVKGTEFAGKTFYRYYPLNMDKFREFKQDGLVVEFTGKLVISNFISIAGLKSLIIYKALPIVLDDMKEVGVEPDPEPEENLAFDIDLKDEFEEGEPISVEAILMNQGEESINVVEMGLEVQTLDLMIKTPDSKILMFNESRYIRKLPEIINIKPGETYSVQIRDITEPGMFLDDEGNGYEFTDGRYMVTGVYESYEVSSTESYEPLFEGKLVSPIHGFVIKSDEPEPENHRPQADFSYKPESPMVGEEVHFYDESTDPDGDELSYEWTFENVIGSFNEKNPTYIYKEPGLYKVTLKVTDPGDASDRITKDVHVREGEPEPENAVISGRVREDPGIPITMFIPVEGATVTVYDAAPHFTPAPGKIYETVTNERGAYELNVEPGSYLIVTTKEGYEKATDSVEVESGEEKMVNFALKRITLDPDFEIDLKRQNFKVGEQIHVAATLTNNGDSLLKVQEMGLEYATLDFIIETPKGRNIHYVGPIVKMYPPIVGLKSGESTTAIIDLTQTDFGSDGNVFKMNEPGEYSITGLYRSVESGELEEDIWRGELSSQTETFIIEG